MRGETCPACGTTRVRKAGAEGEDVVAPAIEVDLRTGEVHCLAARCESRWRLAQYEALAANLGRQAVEVLGG